MKTKNLVITGLLVAIGVILPVLLHPLGDVSKLISPMHIPVFICGLACGWQYGLIAGVLTPLLSSLSTGMPAIVRLPSMMCELAVYGLVAGILIGIVKSKSKTANVYISLIGAMLAGKIVYGILNALIFKAGEYSLQIWITSAFVNSFLAIIINLVLVPIVVMILDKYKIIKI